MGLPWGKGDREIAGEGYEGRLVTSSRKGPGQGWSFSEARSHPQAPGCPALGLREEGHTGSLGVTTEGLEAGRLDLPPGLGSSEGVCCGREPRRAHICPAGREPAVGSRHWASGAPGRAGGLSSSLGAWEGVEPQWLHGVRSR